MQTARIVHDFVKVFIINMSAQAKISSFFTPKGKNKLENLNTENNPVKRQKVVQEDASPGKENIEIQTSVELSPEQKQRIEENKRKAFEKLQAKKLETSQSLLVNFGESWKRALEAEFGKPYFEELTKFVTSERSKGTVFPPAENVFTWTRACPVDQVKVVILGQDPYHGTGQAHGFAFSVLPGIPPPPSLLNMYKELESDIEGFKRPGHGYLQGWASQGVLMLNAVLTVRAHQANSHKDKGWEKLTDAAISHLNKNTSGLVFMLWGSYAQKKGGYIDKEKHHILTGVHPSPLSAHRGFFGCKHFSKCNELLTKSGKAPIDWGYLPVDI
ncbi:uracil-DNA glycosylase-like isoform X2 [Dreissena polymorpha]|nr:uracil-DNA glycosylase-like isoform X2 [Dreissena polymorpha]